jgi:hypothetical protein
MTQIVPSDEVGLVVIATSLIHVLDAFLAHKPTVMWAEAAPSIRVGVFRMHFRMYLEIIGTGHSHIGMYE